MIESSIIYGITLTNVPVYIILLVAITILVFNDCAELDELEN